LARLTAPSTRAWTLLCGPWRVASRAPARRSTMGIYRWFHRLALNALLLVLLIAGLAPVSAAPTVAAAQTLSVDGSDPAASDITCVPSCKTIRGALILAGPGASITVAPGTYPETLTITQSVSITGGVARLPGEQGPTIVDARRTGSVVTIPYVVPPDVLVSLTGLTLTDGNWLGGPGGGIAALGGTLSLSDTTIMSNTGYGGGGIYASNAVTLTDSPVMNNTGGGIEAFGPVTLTGSPVMSNTSPNGGGLQFFGTALVLTSTIAGNTADRGGGLDSNGLGATLTLRNSAVLRNTARSGDGGGIKFDSGSLSIINSTLSANTAAAGGGAIASTGSSLSVSLSTISANSAHSGGGIAAAGGTTTLNATILAGNTAPSGPDCVGAVTSLGDNLIGGMDRCSAVG